MPTLREIATFSEDDPPAGESPWVVQPQAVRIEVVPYDAEWVEQFRGVAARILRALGARALDIAHIGSTAVPGLAAKPVIDVDLIVADPAREAAWLPALEAAGFILTVREPWWHGHRPGGGGAD